MMRFPHFPYWLLNSLVAGIFLLLGWSTNSYASASSEIDSLSHLLSEVSSDTAKIRLLNRLSFAYNQTDLSKSDSLSKKAISLSRQLAYADRLFASYLRQAEIQRLYGNTDSILTYLDSAEKYLEKNTPPRYKGLLFYQRAALAYHLSQYPEAIAYYLKAIPLYEEADYKKGQANVYSSMATIFRLQKDYKQSKDYYLRALDIYEKLNNQKGIANTLYKLGNWHFFQKDYEKAIKYYDRSLEIHDKKGLNYYSAIIRTNKALILRDLGRLEEALVITRESNQFFHALGAKKEIYVSQSNIANILNELGRYKEALREGLLSMKGLDSLQVAEFQKENYFTLSSIYENMDRPAQALTYYQKFTAIKDSLLNATTSQRIAAATAKFESEKKEQENQLLAKENQIQQLELLKQDLALNQSFKLNIALGIGVVLFLTILLLLISRFRSKQREERILLAANQQLELAKTRAESSEKRMGEYLDFMVHELRTPIHAVLGMTSLLKKSPQLEPRKRTLNMLQSASDYLAQMVENILDVSEADQGQLEIESVPFSPKALIVEVHETINVLAETKSLIVHTTLHPSVPEEVIGDRLRLSQILINLMANAIKFTHQGSIHLEVSMLQKANDPRLKFQVTDTGEGISEADQKIIFIRHKRSQDGKKAVIQGSGLGLTIANQLVALHGGQLEVASEPGQGARFFFSIPCILNQSNSSLDAAPKALSGTPYLPPLRILVVEDDPFHQELVREILWSAQSAIQVETVPNGQMALQLLQDSQFDLLITDHGLPGMSGLDLIAHFRNTSAPLQNAMPILLLSANAKAISSPELSAKNRIWALAKPYRPEELLSLMQESIGKCAEGPPHLLQLQRLEQITQGQVNRIREYLTLFLSLSDTQWKALLKARSSQDHKAFIEAAHTIKNKVGMLASVHAIPLINHLEELENTSTFEIGVDHKLRAVHKLLHQLQTEVRNQLH